MFTVFERDFDQELVSEQVQAELDRQRIFTQAELDAAVKIASQAGYDAGFESGHLTGTQEAKNGLEQKYLLAIETTAPQLEQLLGRATEHQAVLEEQCVRFTLSVCEKVFPEFLTRKSPDRAMNKIRETMALTIGSPRVRIFLSPATKQKMAADLHQIANQKTNTSTQQLEILADNKIADGDARVEWDNGFMTYSFDQVCRQILTALRRVSDSFSERENKETP